MAALPDPPRPVPVVCAIIEREGRVLIAQRPPDKLMPLKWEFPGGKVEPGESAEQALARELREELGGTLQRAVLIGCSEFEDPQRGLVAVSFFASTLEPGGLQAKAFQQIAWVLPRELANYDFLPANARLVAELATGRIKPGELLAASLDSTPAD